MRQVKEALRLAASGLTRREISHSLGIGHTTVQRYLERAQRAGLSWPLPPELNEAELEERLFPKVTTAAAERPLPDWLAVHKDLKKSKHVTLKLLWLEWREVHPDGLGYTQFCTRYHEWLGRQDLVMRLSYPAGERMFLDFCGDTVPVVNRETGEIQQAQVFVAALGFSGYLYAEAFWRQDLESWLAGHVHALEFMGGAVQLLVPDNLKAGVSKACWYDPEINPSYLELARHFGAAVLPTRPGHPRDKAACEVGVQVVERWVLAPLRKHRFFELAPLNAAIRGRLSGVNGRPFRGLAVSRADLLKEELEALRPLPAGPYELARFKGAKVSIDYHVEFDDHYYSAPFRLVGEAVEVRATRATVEILHKGQRVASHLRSYSRTHKYVTDPSHMPAAHREHLQWTPTKLIEWGSSVGPSVGEVVETILRTRPHPEHGYRACLGLKRLAKRYGHERLSAACTRALAMRSPGYRTVADILKSGMDRVPPKPSQAPAPAIEHDNVRGPEYYGREAV
jgi:transposase